MALPRRIVEAAARARDTRINELSLLPRRARALLAYVVEHVPANDPKTPVKHDDDYVASRLACSRRTVTTAVDDLQQVGLLERPAQTRLRGRFNFAGYKLTSKAVDLLFAPCAKNAGEIINTVPTAVVIKTDKDRPVKYGKIALPPSLAEWVTSGLFTPHDLVCLMKQAKKAGAKLQDVMTACKTYLLSGITKPAAYVATLIKSNKDWSYLARISLQRQKAKAAQDAAEAKKHELIKLISNANAISWALPNMKVTMTRDLMLLAIEAEGDIVRYAPLDLRWTEKLYSKPYQIVPIAHDQRQATVAAPAPIRAKIDQKITPPPLPPTSQIRLGKYRTEQGLLVTVVQKARQLMLSIAGNHILLPSSSLEAIANNQWEYIGLAGVQADG